MLMLKYAFVLFHLLGVLFVGSLIDDGVIIEDNTPTSLAPGEERMVEISINKGDVSGFAKLQIDLPAGLTAEAGDTHGASFTFSEQKVKFIWMALPSEQVFTVSYKLKAAPTAKGNKVVSGAFSYIKANQRVDYDMQSKMVEVTGEPAAAVPRSGDGTFACHRHITDLGNGNYLIRIDVTNASNDGFVKIRETVPSGFQASENENGGAIVTLNQNSVKFVWFDAPRTPNYAVSYRLTGGMGDPTLSGTLSYVENNAPREMPITSTGPITRAASTTPIAQNEPEPSEDTKASDDAARLAAEAESRQLAAEKATRERLEAQAAQAALKRKAEDEARAAQEAAAKAQAEANAVASNIPEPETGVTYKVQVMAAHKVVDKAYFKSRHGFDEPFGIENHEGWVKYTTGGFDIYKKARDDRERIRNRYNFKGPFVTAYNNGERITVQEALMVTRQQWYK